MLLIIGTALLIDFGIAVLTGRFIAVGSE